MSLPPGVVNRAQVRAHPRVVGSVLRLFLVSLVVLAPLLLYVVVQVHGVKSRYDCSALERQIVAAKDERRTLGAERAKLLAPERLRAEADRLGLVPPTLPEFAGRPEPRAGAARTIAVPVPATGGGAVGRP